MKINELAGLLGPKLIVMIKRFDMDISVRVTLNKMLIPRFMKGLVKSITLSLA